jgi:hypothetical protein
MAPQTRPGWILAPCLLKRGLAREARPGASRCRNKTRNARRAGDRYLFFVNYDLPWLPGQIPDAIGTVLEIIIADHQYASRSHPTDESREEVIVARLENRRKANVQSLSPIPFS